MCASLCVNFGEYESCGVVLSSVGFDSSAQGAEQQIDPGHIHDRGGFDILCR